MIWKLLGGEHAFYGFLLLVLWGCGWVWIAFEVGKKAADEKKPLPITLNTKGIVFCYVASLLLFLLLFQGLCRIFENPPPPPVAKE